MKYLSLIVLILLLGGCESKPEAEPTFPNMQFQQEFSAMLEDARPALETILRQEGITAKPLGNDKDWLSCSVAEQTKKDQQSGLGFGLAIAWGEHEVFDGIIAPTCVAMQFWRIDGTWCLSLDRGYISGDAGEDGKPKYSPELNSRIKQLFANHIDLSTAEGLKRFSQND